MQTDDETIPFMNPRLSRLLTEILSLKQCERSALLFALWNRHDTEVAGYDALEAWKQTAQDRLDSLDHGAVNLCTITLPKDKP
jgi:hypothetical protein